jgi:diguanylate cyclase (GGDEF)-like protein/PAS domain S-box-containing protein
MTRRGAPRSEAETKIAGLLGKLQGANPQAGKCTAAELDTGPGPGPGRERRAHLLRRAQDQRRYRDAARETAILNALPAHVLLLDTHGVIVSVNEAWRQLADSNQFRDSDYGLGLNYLALCESTAGSDAQSAHAAAKGIRSVLSGAAESFSTEYFCDTPAGRRWFLLSVTPLAQRVRRGAVVMHVNVTDKKRDQQSLMQFAAAMDATMDAIYLIDRAEMKILHCNDAACRMQGKTREQVFAAGLAAASGIPLAELATSYDRLIAGSGVDVPVELARQRADGSPYWLEVRRQAQLMDGRWLIVSLVRDVSERKLADLRIAQLQRVQAMLSGINTLVVRVRDHAELFKEACNIAVAAGGFAMAWIGLLDRGLLEIVPVASVGATEDLLTCIEQGLSMTGANAAGSPIVRVIREKGSVVVNDLQSNPNSAMGPIYAAAGIRSLAILPLIVADEAVGVLALYAEEGVFFHADELTLLTELASDIAFAIDHIEKRDRLEYLAFYDPLTGLANRALFLDRVSQCLRTAANEGKTLALILIDLERFKNVNDSLGRPAGDELLRQVAEWLTKKVGDSSLLARVGADHFAAVLPALSTGIDPAQLIKETLQAFLKHPFLWKGASYRLSAKTGVALFPVDGTGAETLFGNAEAALKKAKTGGDPCLFYAHTMRDAAAGRLSLESQLRQALDQEQFVLHYQPKINLATGKIMGAEALIRWNDPNTGLVPPGRFIPILEETGLINEVGRWALQRAIGDYLCWRRAGLSVVRIAVNVSALQLGSRGFVHEVEKILGADPMAAAGLELEITESLIMADVKHSVASLRKLRSMGVTVAIDDFGTGFSSLSYLAQLPINTLKIDRSFVAELATTHGSSVLVAMIINLAHSLKLSVVAEGVETAEQLGILRELGCDNVQGYLYSKPVPGAAFCEQFLAWG